MKLTRRERVFRALQHKETDIVPYHVDFTQQAYQKFITAKGEEYIKNIQVHMHALEYWGHPSPIEGKPDYYRDDFGVIWNRSGADKDIGVVDSPIVCKPDISLRPEPNFDESLLRKKIEQLLATSEDKFTIGAIGFSMYERLWTYTGMEEALVNMIAEPEFTNELLDAICEFNCKVIDIYNEYPLDGVLFGDDWGQQKGLIMGPELWRKFIKPRMAVMYERARKNGKFILQHSCGDIHELFPDLIEIGLDCYQTFQPEIYDIKNIKEEYGQYLAFWGGISTQQLLPFATPDVVKNEVRRIMEIMLKDGGYIAAPTHAMPSDIPVENIIAMIEVFQNQ